MIRLFLTDGHAAAREVLHIGLSATAGLEIVGEASSGTELLGQLAATAPTVVLLDLNLPGPNVIALLPVLSEQYPQLRVLARGELSSEKYVARALNLGAHGYLLKSTLPSELTHAIKTVAAGRPYLCSAIGLALLRRSYMGCQAPGDTARITLGLSKREMEVLGLVAKGLTNAEISDKLFTSKRTIETHRQNIMEKTQTRNTAALIKLAACQGLLPE